MPTSALIYAVELLRRAIGDPEGAAQQFTAEELELFLDQTRTDVVERDLDAIRTPSGGTLVTLRHVVPADLRGLVWATVSLTDSSRQAVTPDGSNLALGEWTFLADTLGPLYLTGAGYDINAAGAIACDTWAAALSRTSYDFSADGASYHRSQAVKQLRETADNLRSRSRGSQGGVQVAQLVRSDWNGAA